MDCLVTVLLTDGLGDKSRQLALSNLLLVEYHTPDNDPIDGVHLGQAAVNLLLEDPVSNIFLHAVWVGNLFTDSFQCVHGYCITAPAIRTVGAITHTDVPRGSITFTSPLELLPLLPKRAHDRIEFLVGQGRPGRIAGQVVGLLSTGICLV